MNVHATGGGAGEQRDRLSDIDVALYALYLLDGWQKRIHTEDVALKCFELAATKFSWVKHPRYPDPTPARHALEDAKKEKYRRLVTGASEKGRASGKTTGWMFTAEGIAWLESNRGRIEGLLGKSRPTSDRLPRQKVLRQLKLIREHPLFARYIESPAHFAPMIGELASMLRCRVDAEPEVWAGRFERVLLQAKFAGQSDVEDFIAKCRDAYKKQA